MLIINAYPDLSRLALYRTACILSIVKQITSPGWMHETSARGWCTGKTQRNQVEREVGGGSGWGTHVTPWLIHVNVWQNPLQCCQVISLQLIKINEEKKKTCSLQMDLLETQWGTINMDNQQEPPVYHRKLYAMFCDDLYVKRMWEKN